MYQSTCWPGVADFKIEFQLWCTWLKEKIDFIVFKIYQYESRLE
ncbi:MAG: hypothetical protein ACI4S3_07040 [Candidatus Gastranaerophilaceae bacterium]